MAQCATRLSAAWVTKKFPDLLRSHMEVGVGAVQTGGRDGERVLGVVSVPVLLVGVGCSTSAKRWRWRKSWRTERWRAGYLERPTLAVLSRFQASSCCSTTLKSPTTQARDSAAGRMEGDKRCQNCGWRMGCCSVWGAWMPTI